jgi:hypothetical protein
MHGCSNKNHKHRDRREWRRYRCAGYVRNGFCHFHWVDEAPLYRCLMEKLQAEFLHPDNLKELRVQWQHLAEGVGAAPDPGRVRKLRAKLTALEGQIAKGQKRLLLIPENLLAGAAEALGEWQRQRDDLMREVEALERGPEETKVDIEERIRHEEAKLWRLHEALASADPAEIRAVLGELIATVELWWRCGETAHGHRKCEFARGLIRLKADDYRLVAHGGPSCA